MLHLLAAVVLATPASIAYVQPSQAPALAPCLKVETRMAEVTNLLTGQQIVAIADGNPCCYRKDGKSYSSVYKGGSCVADTTYLCFRQQMEQMLASFDPGDVGGPNRTGGSGTRQRQFFVPGLV